MLAARTRINKPFTGPQAVTQLRAGRGQCWWFAKQGKGLRAVGLRGIAHPQANRGGNITLALQFS